MPRRKPPLIADALLDQLLDGADPRPFSGNPKSAGKQVLDGKLLHLFLFFITIKNAIIGKNIIINNNILIAQNSLEKYDIVAKEIINKTKFLLFALRII